MNTEAEKKQNAGINGSGIYRWDDPNEINQKLAALTSQPVWEVNDDYYENTVLKYYDEKCTKSKAIYEEAKNYIPGGVQHNLAFNKPFPVAFSKAEGAYLYACRQAVPQSSEVITNRFVKLSKTFWNAADL